MTTVTTYSVTIGDREKGHVNKLITQEDRGSQKQRMSSSRDMPMMPVSTVWHTQGSLGRSGYRESVGSKQGDRPECSICFSSYDNVFKTPKVLDCTHTFCLECLARMLAVSDDFKKQGMKWVEDGTQISCPVCRRPTTVPRKGPPGLMTSREVLQCLPDHLQQEEEVSMDGRRLCYLSPLQPSCICIDIGATKPESRPAPQENRGWWSRCSSRLGCSVLGTDWRRLLLLIIFLTLIISVAVWPTYCIITKRTLCSCFGCSRPTPEPTSEP